MYVVIPGIECTWDNTQGSLITGFPWYWFPCSGSLGSNIIHVGPWVYCVSQPCVFAALRGEGKVC